MGHIVVCKAAFKILFWLSPLTKNSSYSLQQGNSQGSTVTVCVFLVVCVYIYIYVNIYVYTHILTDFPPCWIALLYFKILTKDFFP